MRCSRNVAAFGNGDAAAARAAYAAGLAALGWKPGSTGEPSFEPPAAARDLGSLDVALRALGAVGRTTSCGFCAACTRRSVPTARVEVDEQELFRAIAATLDCPLPPGFAA